MITQAEARALVDSSNVVMEARIEKIGEKISEAAALGKTELWLSDVLYSDEFQINHQPYRSAGMTPLQQLVKKELSKYGFNLEIKTRSTQIGGGLGSMDVEVRHEDLPYLYIRW